MKVKFISAIQIAIFVILASALIIPQQSHDNRPQSSGNKKIYKQYQSHKSTLGKPANVTNHKRKDFTVNRKENINKNKNTRRDSYKRDYTNKRDNRNITKSENYFHIDKSGNTLWDGKHWDMDEYPLKVYVKEASSKYYKSAYKEYVNYAFEVWQKADNRIRFTFTNNSRDADVQFIFVEDLGKTYEENYLGLTEYDVNRDNEIEQSTIQISLLKFRTETVSAGELKATIIHELGHAFGLGHSDSNADIMYPYISSDHTYKMTYNELSRGDKEAIKDVIDLGSDNQFVYK
jgi:predicted Zn-dependent protease